MGLPAVTYLWSRQATGEHVTNLISGMLPIKCLNRAHIYFYFFIYFFLLTSLLYLILFFYY